MVVSLFMCGMIGKDKMIASEFCADMALDNVGTLAQIGGKKAEDAMPYHDDTDRYCRTCGGKRYLIDASRDDYGYSARSTMTCWACVPASEPEAIPSKDDLIDAAVARMAAEAGMTIPAFRQAQWNSMHGEEA